MHPQAIACPYCNSQFHLPANPPAGRIHCPRCGEALPASITGAGVQDVGPPLMNGQLQTAASADPAARRRRNRMIALGVLGIMLLMALGGLWLSLETVPGRRLRDPKDPLGYLPADTNLVALLQVRAALQEPGGVELLSSLGVGGADAASRLEELTGIQRQDIQTALVGIRLDDRFPPRVVLVVQTGQPYDEARVRDALPNALRLDRAGRALYRFTPRRGALSATLWFAAQSLLVVATQPEDFDSIPTEPRPGSAHLPAALDDFIRMRVPAQAQAWLAVHSDDWQRVVLRPVIAGVLGVKPDDLADAPTWGGWARFERGIAFEALGHAKDVASARRLALDLRRRHALAEEKVHVEADWVVADGQADADTVRRYLERAFSAGFLSGR
jgi:hypothetical protein